VLNWGKSNGVLSPLRVTHLITYTSLSLSLLFSLSLSYSPPLVLSLLFSPSCSLSLSLSLLYSLSLSLSYLAHPQFSLALSFISKYYTCRKFEIFKCLKNKSSAKINLQKFKISLILNCSFRLSKFISLRLSLFYVALSFSYHLFMFILSLELLSPFFKNRLYVPYYFLSFFSLSPSLSLHFLISMFSFLFLSLLLYLFKLSLSVPMSLYPSVWIFVYISFFLTLHLYFFPSSHFSVCQTLYIMTTLSLSLSLPLSHSFFSLSFSHVYTHSMFVCMFISFGCLSLVCMCVSLSLFVCLYLSLVFLYIWCQMTFFPTWNLSVRQRGGMRDISDIPFFPVQVTLQWKSTLRL